ncbi:hypothetical protein BHE74_00010655 [Ensete ventricosum]|nr:hypothetical protein GW17_00034249 [Ensete ventricosum]RWW80981.1 hypothetical protein BHE74_00010655 [Ensete ventricosum]
MLLIFPHCISSNVAAGNLFGIPLRGTHSHAFVSSYMSPDEIVDKSLRSHDGSSTCRDFLSLVQTWLSKLQVVDCLAVMRSGIPNFCAVALALNDLGYKASGIRLDSGDLAYLSIEARKFFHAIEKEFNVPGFGKMNITASNDLNEETLDALNKQVSIPCKKRCFRLYGREGYPLVDIMTGENETPPTVSDNLFLL